MERYTQWRDKATGISPFLPVHHAPLLGTVTSNLEKFFKSTKLDKVGLALLFTIRAALGAPFLLVWALILLIGNIRLRLLDKVVAFVLGVTSVEFSVEGVKLKNVNIDFYPSVNDIVFVNFTSALDYLVLSITSNGPLVLLVADGNGSLHKVSPLELMSISLSGVKTSSSPVITEAAQLKGKVCYIFAEGTTSNGRSVLPFTLSQGQFDRFVKGHVNFRTKALSIKYNPSSLTTPIKSSSFHYLFQLLTTGFISTKLRLNTINNLNSKEVNLERIRASFCNNGKLKLVELDIHDKEKFLMRYK